MLIAAQILNIESCKIEKRYEDLIIKSKKEIDITYEDISSLTSKKISEVYKILEQKIIEKKLDNRREMIISFIKHDIDN